MPNIYPPLSNNQERIERSIYHWLRGKVIEEGYTVDTTDDTTYPNTTQGEAQLKADIAAIVANKSYAIDVFGVGSSQAVEIKKVPRFVIRHRMILPGPIATPESNRYFVDNGLGTGFYRTRYQGRSQDLYFDVHLVSNTAAQNRILHAIYLCAMRGARYIPYYDEPTAFFFIDSITHRDYTDTTDGLIENVYSFKVDGVYLVEDTVYTDDIIAMITCIQWDVVVTDDINNQAYNDSFIDTLYIGECTLFWATPEGTFWVTEDGENWTI
jgi:hypothetical protein